MLKAAPDWPGAARAFVAGVNAQPDREARLEFVDACRAEFGEMLYPGFLKLLAAVAAFSDGAERALCAEVLADGLAAARLPAARVPAWGGPPGLFSAQAQAPQILGRGGLAMNLRALGPIEFLCVWLTRDLVGEPLDRATFRTALRWLLVLFGASERAADLYRARLRAGAEDPMEGLHSRESRELVRAVAKAWSAGAAPEAVVAAAAEGAADPFARLAR